MSTEQTNPVWVEKFSEKARDKQVTEDSEAWNSVTGLLLAIVTLGVSLAAITVAIITF